jgi:NAD(P)-dependent dehydrogenase (short-subunit alcohol dehydrogenase family)
VGTETRPEVDCGFTLPDLAGWKVVVTGANSGLGRVAAAELAEAGASVTLAVRDLEKGHQAAAEMDGQVDVARLDLADLASVRRFASQWAGPLDVLVANAGIMAVPKQTTRDGFESQIGTNHLGHFALANLLLPALRDRVVVVTSLMHRRGRIDLSDLNWQRRRYKPWAAYAASKLANLLFVLELQRRLDQSSPGLRALASHPGYAATNLQTRTGSPLANWLGSLGNRMLAQSAQMGALPTLYAAVEDLPGATLVGPDGMGQIRGCPTVVPPAPPALDTEMASKLWKLSEELTGVCCPLGL